MWRGLGALALMAMVATPALAAPHRVVFDLASGDPEDWHLALNNVTTAESRLCPEGCQIEVVAYGPGVDFLLKANERFEARIKALSQKGVTFAACELALANRKHKPEELFPFAQLVPSGIVELITKQEAGWPYIKAGR